MSGNRAGDTVGAAGWVGRVIAPLGWKLAYTRGGVVVAMVLVSLPFIVRTLQPALADLPLDVEEAAATLGGGRLRTVWSVVVPQLLPALGSGFALAFARAVGEYGSVRRRQPAQQDRDRAASFATEAMFSHLGLTKEQRARIDMKYYEAGHML